MAVVAAADIAPKAFEQLVREGGENQDVEDDLQVSQSPDRLRDRSVQRCETVSLSTHVIGVVDACRPRSLCFGTINDTAARIISTAIQQ